MRKLFFFLLMAAALSGCGKPAEPVSNQLHAFYYPWYGTPEHDGRFIHWRHDVMGDGPAFTFPGGQDIGADFYPEGGCYSSSDPQVLHRHMRQLQQGRVGVICVSWLGPESFEAQILPQLMDIAAEHGIMVNFHLEPAVQGSIQTIAEAIKYLTENYGQHPAFYRAPETGGRGLFYVYDSYKTPASQWARLLTPEGDLTIRGTKWDAAVVGLILNESDTAFIESSGMDGGYAYFAVDGFSYASTTANWSRLAAWAEDESLLFIPSVGPGYADLRIRPWNNRNQRPRDGGRYYDCMFAKAIASGSSIISITSFNEWHEGTQIEPAMAFSTDGFTYLDYQPLQPDGYLTRTADWVAKWATLQEKNGWSDLAAADICAGGHSRSAVTHLAVGRTLYLSESFSETYAAGGAGGLVDGTIASNNYRDGCWQGYEGVDLVARIDLGKTEEISSLRLGFLLDSAVWIFGPKSIEVEGSDDGKVYKYLAGINPTFTNDDTTASRQEKVIGFESQHLRFLKITIEAQKTCPAGHPGSSKPAWLFIDEIQVH